MSKIKFTELGATPATPAAGKVCLYFEAGALKSVDDGGAVTTYAVGLTQEEVEDIVGALIVSSGAITVNYDDGAGTLTIGLDETLIDHTNLQNVGGNTHAQIDAHIASVTNPHNVTATQIGLGNVDNTSDADKPVSTAQAAADTAVQNFSIQRANHTGTQTASTISDFEDAVRQVYDTTQEQDNSEAVNTDNAVWDERHDITKTPQHTDDYNITVHYTWAYDDGGTNFQAELLINGGVVREHEQEPKDVGGADGGAGTDQRHMAVMRYTFSATSAVDFDVVFRFKPQSNGVEATIRDSNIEIKRALEV